MTRSVLVTGASSGIGRTTAELLARSGFRVFCGVRHLPDNPASGNLYPICVDVTDPGSISSARAQVEQILAGDGLFALVNNAGIGDTRPLEFTPLEKFRAILDVNPTRLLQTDHHADRCA